MKAMNTPLDHKDFFSQNLGGGIAQLVSRLSVNLGTRGFGFESWSGLDSGHPMHE